MATREEFTFFHPLRVRWAELDPQGIVFNANYLMYFDVTLTEYMRAIGFPYPDGLKPFGTDIFLVNASVDFRGSALFDDQLEVGARAARIGRTSLGFVMAAFRGAEPLVEGTLVYVNGEHESKKPTPLPAPFVERILAFERTAPERKA
jgi:acyl-CoA thioester hydrolase